MSGSTVSGGHVWGTNAKPLAQDRRRLCCLSKHSIEDQQNQTLNQQSTNASLASWRPANPLGCRTDSEGSSFTDGRSDAASVLHFKGVFTATKCRIADLSSPPIFICLALHCRRFQIFDLEPATHRLAQSQKGGPPHSAAPSLREETHRS